VFAAKNRKGQSPKAWTACCFLNLFINPKLLDQQVVWHQEEAGRVLITNAEKQVWQDSFEELLTEKKLLLL
jgi:hypothetical protein